MEGDSKSAQKSRTLLFKVTDLRRNCRPDVHERTEGSSFADRFYMVSCIFLVRRCPKTTGHFCSHRHSGYCYPLCYTIRTPSGW